MAASLYFLNAKNYLPALLTGGTLITGVLIRYKNAVRYLKKPSLWIQLLIITLLASLLWEWFSTGKFLSLEGLVIGLEINFRALVIIFSFSAISVELRNPLVRSLLYRNGFSNLYKSVSMAFSVLPGIIGHIPKKSNLFRERKNVLHTILQLAGELISIMEKEAAPHDNILLLTGKVQSGKSMFISDFVETCKINHLSISGFIAKGTFIDGKRESFILIDIETGRTMQLAGRTEVKGWIRHRDFYLNPEAFRWGEKLLKKGLERRTNLLVLDELGPLELGGKGWSNIIEIMEKNYDIPQLWVVREKILKEVADRWQIPGQNLIHLETADAGLLLSRIKSLNKKRL
jgi:nucleoside-triphosphatase THEP1